MSTFSIYISIAVLTVIIIETFILFVYKNEQDKRDIELNGVAESECLSNIEMLIRVLNKLSIQYKIDDDRTTVTLRYDGETLLVNNLDNDPNITIIDPWWYEAPADDIDNLSMLIKAVNSCNYNKICTLVYTIDKESRTVGLHSIKTILWVEEIPYLKEYLCSSLSDVLYMRHIFYDKMEELRRKNYSENHTSADQ